MNSVLKHNDQRSIFVAGEKLHPALAKKLYIETYGCQMNVADSEIIAGVLTENDYELTKEVELADIILINTCSIRKNAEDKVFRRIQNLKKYKQTNKNLLIGVVGCMAEHSQSELMENKVVDIIAGPDNYSSLPQLISDAFSKGKAISTELSTIETYDKIVPIHSANAISAFVPIMRGCNNFCSYCVVPYTRGKERSRDHNNITDEVKSLINKGYKEVTLIGQNVNSYNFKSTDRQYNFAGLLENVAKINPGLRVRFATSHPKDLNEDIVKVMADFPNVCKHIHLPFQSGSNRILKLMNRKYTREWYLDQIQMIRDIIPDISITTDIIAGFCSESDEDHELTIDLMNLVRFDMAYMFFYSERTGTFAASNLKDDVPLAIKKQRLSEIIALQNEHSLLKNRSDLNKTFEVLIEGKSKKSSRDLKGRTSQNKMVVFPSQIHKVGEYINVFIKDSTSATLIGEIIK
jgi:tRNA-2-methylthio-N6-dimethylallyladenosine synthase